jgi:hypothetical protein
MNNTRKTLVRGILAILISATIFALIKGGIAEPYPNYFIAYMGCGVIGLFGVFEMFKSVV